MSRIWVLVWAAAIGCGGSSSDVVISDSGDPSDGGSSDGGGDGGETGTDDDGDGFTVEDGDCDDADIGVNPAREENPNDGKDNDCDGRVDEEWAGTTVALQRATGWSSLAKMDTVSRITEEVDLDDGVVPYGVSAGLDGGWAVTSADVFINISAGTPSFEYAPADLVAVSDSGVCTTLFTAADPSSDPESPSYDPMSAPFYWFGPLLRGAALHPDGYYVVATPGSLVRVDADGTSEVLAEWAFNLNDGESFEFYAQSIAVDLRDGTVGIQGLLGGFATWSSDGGLTMHRQVDLSDGWDNWDAMMGVALTHMDGDGFYGMVADYAVGDYALSRFDDVSGEWAVSVEWSDSLLRPLGLVADGDHGSFYVTSKGGDHFTVWLIDPTRGIVDDFYDETADGHNFWGLSGVY